MGGDDDAFTLVIVCFLMATALSSVYMVARACAVHTRAAVLAVRAPASPRAPVDPPHAPPTPCSAPPSPRPSRVWRAVHQPGGERAVACATLV